MKIIVHVYVSMQRLFQYNKNSDQFNFPSNNMRNDYTSTSIIYLKHEAYNDSPVNNYVQICRFFKKVSHNAP